jgi:hypothetical protein
MIMGEPVVGGHNGPETLTASIYLISFAPGGKVGGWKVDLHYSYIQFRGDKYNSTSISYWFTQGKKDFEGKRHSTYEFRWIYTLSPGYVGIPPPR